MSRGRLIRPLKATFAQLDTAAIGTATNYDDEFREVKKVDSDSDGIGETERVEKAELTIDVQVETNTEERQRMAASGNVPDSRMELIAHRREFEERGLVNAAGKFAIKVNDRLVRLSDKWGTVISTFDLVPLYVTEIKPIDGWLGFTSNLIKISVNDRPQGVA